MYKLCKYYQGNVSLAFFSMGYQLELHQLRITSINGLHATAKQ